MDCTVRGEVVHEPLLVQVARGSAGDHSKLILAQPHNRQVRLETTALVQQRRIYSLTDRDIHLIDSHLLDVIQRTRTRNIKYRESGEIHEAYAITHCQMLGVDDR